MFILRYIVPTEDLSIIVLVGWSSVSWGNILIILMFIKVFRLQRKTFLLFYCFFLFIIKVFRLLRKTFLLFYCFFFIIIKVFRLLRKTFLLLWCFFFFFIIFQYYYYFLSWFDSRFSQPFLNRFLWNFQERCLLVT